MLGFCFFFVSFVQFILQNKNFAQFQYEISDIVFILFVDKSLDWIWSQKYFHHNINCIYNFDLLMI